MINVLKNFGVGLLVIGAVFLGIGIIALIIAGLWWLMGMWIWVALWLIVIGPFMVWLIYDIGADIRQERYWNKRWNDQL